MILHIKDAKEIFSKIGSAVDTSDTISAVSQSLEMSAKGKVFTINVTNKEYYVQYKTELDNEEYFQATVNASLLLKLIPMITTETVEFVLQDNVLVVKGNGVYTIPIIYNGAEPLKLPEIKVDNYNTEFEISTATLQSILDYNAKELKKGTISRPEQKMFYLDSEGAITYTTGACVNMFNIDKPIKVLLSSKVVNLFKLFDSNTVKVRLSKEIREDGLTENKIAFITDNLCVYAYLNNDETLLERVPVTNIRGRATKEYPYQAIINKENILQAINRLLVFVKDNMKLSKFVFDFDRLTIYDTSGKSYETVPLERNCTGISSGESYSVYISLDTFKTTLETCFGDTFEFNFGDKKAVTVVRGPGKIVNIIPEKSYTN